MRQNGLWSFLKVLPASIFSRSPPVKSPSTADVFDAVGRFGELVETYPLHVFDVCLLSMPKPEMKTALKKAWRVANPARRRAIEVGFVQLASFQDGVGPKPISLALSDVLSTETSQMAWIKGISDEKQLLLREFGAFKQAQLPSPADRAE
jgi:hypothetical protein